MLRKRDAGRHAEGHAATTTRCVNPERAQQRRNVVLAQMVKRGKLRRGAATARCATQPLQLQLQAPARGRSAPAPHFAEHVRKWLIEWADEHDYDIYADGLVIAHHASTRGCRTRPRRPSSARPRRCRRWPTSNGAQPGAARRVDVARGLRQRSAAGRAVRALLEQRSATCVDAFVRETPRIHARRVEGGASEAAALKALMADAAFMARLRSDKTRLEAGFVAMDPATGEVKAWVGSRDFERRPVRPRARRPQRQPGSTFKPFVYGAALEAGIQPDRTLRRRAGRDPRSATARSGSPTDMSGTSGQPMTPARRPGACRRTRSPRR